jgi:sugar lactone lactonase YvrE
MRTNAGRDIWTLRTGCVVLGFGLLLMVLVSTSPAAHAESGDRIADRVLGHSTFTSGAPNDGLPAPTARSLWRPVSVFVHQSSGRLFVADRSNWRVQSWPHANSFVNDAPADFSIALTTTVGDRGIQIDPDPIAAVTDSSGNLYLAEMINNRILVYKPYTAIAPSYIIGQQNITTTRGNQDLDFPTANTLSGPNSLATDGSGHLFVADLLNSRVLRYTLPIVTNNQAADLELGQAGFDLGLANRGSSFPGNNTLNKPQGVAVDSAGAVYVSDSDNHRVLKFSPPFGNGMAATLVLGQPTFVTNAVNQGRGTSSPTAQTLNKPVGIAIDKDGHIYVNDNNNYRMVGYNPIGLVNGAAAQFLLGQTDFETPGSPAPSNISVGYPYGVAVDSTANVYVADRDNNRVLGFDLPWVSWNLRLPLIIK